MQSVVHQPNKSRGLTRRLTGHAGVSVIAFVLSQVGLFVGYGVFRWSIVVAMGFSLTVSAVPAYLMSRRWVWPDRGSENAGIKEGTYFFMAALAGAAIALAIATIAERVATNKTDNHMVLALMVNGSNIAATIALWAIRFIVLDRLVFKHRTNVQTTDSTTGRQR